MRQKELLSTAIQTFLEWQMKAFYKYCSADMRSLKQPKSTPTNYLPLNSRLVVVTNSIFSFLGAGDPVDYLPFLAYFPSPAYKQFEADSLYRKKYIQSKSDEF